MHNNLKKLTLSGMFLALCLFLPFLTGQVPQIGSTLLPMHIPVFLCGFVCGWPYGLAVGFVAPLLRFMLFGMPPIFPVGISMAFELATYGVISGILYRILPKKVVYTYLTLIFSMLIGRIVWGVIRFILMGLNYTQFSFTMFISGAFTAAIPGIVCQIILIPIIIVMLKKARLITNE